MKKASFWEGLAISDNHLAEDALAIRIMLRVFSSNGNHQTRKPPILPPFSAIFKDGANPATVKKSLSNFINYGKSNKESLAELFVTLPIKLSSVQNLWPKGLCECLQGVAMSFETGWTKKIQSTEGWREMADDGWEGTKYAMPSDPRNGQQLTRGWGGTQHSGAGLHGGVHAKGWGGTLEPFARGWGVTREPVLRGWGGVDAEGWEITRELVVGRDRVHAEGWGRTRHPIARGRDRVHAENWRGTQQPIAGGWGEVCAEGWGRTQQPVTGSWGWERDESKGGTQQPITEG
ncbi:Hypothetical predicted protein [Olea europaea subsp. europaea]|uniref:Uncharacterized protein n=1 Tax=Olea europaea subsp. europaea TaxID=158383 RepID=A0A8S0V1F2_OLEEU|nr:Hypothetical predicted protein [Olea europaea subsp. europaea]